ANQKKEWDASFTFQLKNLVDKINPKSVHTYLPMGSELDIFPFIKFLLSKKITVACPQTLPKRRLRNWVLTDLNNLQDGVYGTKYPKDAERFDETPDLVIVPGLAYDKHGIRLGYGGGYYDTFLKTCPESGLVALAYPFQMVDRLPAEAHDHKIPKVLSP